jgi:hypothetical protein
VKLKRRDSDLLYHLQGRQINEEKGRGGGGGEEGGRRGKGLIGWVGVALIEVI